MDDRTIHDTQTALIQMIRLIDQIEGIAECLAEGKLFTAPRPLAASVPLTPAMRTVITALADTKKSEADKLADYIATLAGPGTPDTSTLENLAAGQVKGHIEASIRMLESFRVSLPLVDKGDGTYRADVDISNAVKIVDGNATLAELSKIAVAAQYLKAKAVKAKP